MPFNQKAIDQLNEFIFVEAQRVEQITLLMAETKNFLRSQKILYPSENTLERIIVSQREKVRQFIFTKMLSLLTQATQALLDDLLKVDETRFSKLQQLKRPPAHPSPQALFAVTRKLEIIQQLKILELNLLGLTTIISGV